MKGRKVPTPPEDFEYVMWEKDGKFFVRIKGQNQAVVVNDDVKLYLRSLEKSIRRQHESDRSNLDNFGLDFNSSMNLESLLEYLKYQNPEIYLLRKLDWEEILGKLTDKQYAVFVECFVYGLTYEEHGNNVQRTSSTIGEHAQSLKKKLTQFFSDPELFENKSPD